ncbi:methyl-accepting chemotaxis protein [Gorillibacterium massiliense]|uniref:methyl-accepting chemotaxis protein n=1 Tax=Gorillibacterium massiliense TaxID=1280390 RepID=UPI000592F309|nr:methyl-accepting chemotaxis protein [Gorillibacterium massiliense]
MQSIFRNLSVGKKILVLVVISMIMLTAVEFINFQQSGRIINKSNHMYNDSFLTTRMLYQIKENQIQNEAYILQIMMESDAKVMQELTQKIDELVNHNNGLIPIVESKLKAGSEEAKLFAQYRSELTDYRAERKKVLDFAKANQLSEAKTEYAKLYELQLNVDERLAQQLDILNDNAEKMKGDEEKLANQARNFGILAWVGSLILLLAGSYGIGVLLIKPLTALQEQMGRGGKGDLTVRGDYESRDEIGRLTSSFNTMISGLKEIVYKVNESSLTLSASSQEMTASSEQTAKASEQIASVTTELSAGMEEQVKSVVAAADSVKMMTDNLSFVVKGSDELQRLTDDTLESTERGASTVGEIATGMNDIDQSVQASQVIIRELSGKSDEIGEIITTVKGIAEQTNLLALNAAIEAARAGESGRGFAVVAGEIRKLADASSQSSKHIENLIDEIRVKTSRAVHSMDNEMELVRVGVNRSRIVSEAFRAIEQSAFQVSRKMEEIRSSIGKVTVEGERVNAEMTHIHAVSQEAMAGIEEASAASEQQLSAMEEVAHSSRALAELAEELQNSLSRFQA